MFCDSLNDPNEKRPNFNVCPVCLGHPGTLPTINQEAVEYVLKLGLALNSKISKTSKFDRKNYFYPDLPKGYQISQYDMPLVIGGYLEIPVLDDHRESGNLKFKNQKSKLQFKNKKIAIRRIHLEEDTGRLQHSPDGKSSLVDFNRAGIPLMELVTEPDIKSGEQAVKFSKELQLILRYLGISDADMEKGQLRVEANLSISSGKKLGTKVEIKNLNSFKAVGDAIDYEIKRQEEVLEDGGKIIQETRGWDENKRQTFSQRQKEESHDYRYFPEPDLPPLDLTKFNLELFKEELPELPEEKRKRFVKEFGLAEKQVEVLVQDRHLANYFEEGASELKTQLPITNYQLLLNYLTSDLLGLMNQEGVVIKELKITPEHLAHLVALIEKKEISSRMAKDLLLQMFETGEDPHEIIKEQGIAAVHDENIIRKAIQEVIKENPGAISDYKKGKINVVQFMVGKAMAKLKGQGNPDIINKILKQILTEE